MNRTSIALVVLSLAHPALATPPPMTLEQQADDALANDRNAWNFVEGLTTEVGPRQAGTEAEARGRAWAPPRRQAGSRPR